MAEILVCDDDKAIVEAIEIYLSQEGHHILCLLYTSRCV